MSFISHCNITNYTLTYLLTNSMQHSPSWEATGFQLVKKFPAFYENRRFITAVTNTRHLSLSWASSIQSITPHSISLRSILILSSHLRLFFPSCLFSSGYPTKSVYPIRATCSTHHILLDLITRTILGQDCRSLSSSLCSFLHSHVASSLLT